MKDALKVCSENDLDDMIKKGFFKNVTKTLLKSLLSNLNFNFGQYLLNKICNCPYLYRVSTECSQYRILFASMRIYEPFYLEL